MQLVPMGTIKCDMQRSVFFVVDGAGCIDYHARPSSYLPTFFPTRQQKELLPAFRVDPQLWAHGPDEVSDVQ